MLPLSRLGSEESTRAGLSLNEAHEALLHLIEARKDDDLHVWLVGAQCLQVFHERRKFGHVGIREPRRDRVRAVAHAHAARHHPKAPLLRGRLDGHLQRAVGREERLRCLSEAADGKRPEEVEGVVLLTVVIRRLVLVNIENDSRDGPLATCLLRHAAAAASAGSWLLDRSLTLATAECHILGDRSGGGIRRGDFHYVLGVGVHSLVLCIAGVDGHCVAIRTTARATVGAAAGGGSGITQAAGNASLLVLGGLLDVGGRLHDATEAVAVLVLLPGDATRYDVRIVEVSARPEALVVLVELERATVGALVQLVEDLLVGGHVEPHRLALRVRQCESDVAADPHALRVADHELAHQIDHLLVGETVDRALGRHIHIATTNGTLDMLFRPARISRIPWGPVGALLATHHVSEGRCTTHAKQLQLIPELANEVGGERRPSAAPRVVGLNLAQSRELVRRRAACVGQQMRLVEHEAVHMHVLGESRGQVLMRRRQDHIGGAQVAQGLLVVLTALVVRVHLEAGRELLHLVLPLLHERVVDDDERHLVLVACPAVGEQPLEGLVGDGLGLGRVGKDERGDHRGFAHAHFVCEPSAAHSEAGEVVVAEHGGVRGAFDVHHEAKGLLLVRPQLDRRLEATRLGLLDGVHLLDGGEELVAGPALDTARSMVVRRHARRSGGGRARDVRGRRGGWRWRSLV